MASWAQGCSGFAGVGGRVRDTPEGPSRWGGGVEAVQGRSKILAEPPCLSASRSLRPHTQPCNTPPSACHPSSPPTSYTHSSPFPGAALGTSPSNRAQLLQARPL